MFPKVKKPKKLIYLDYASTTPLDPKVKKAMGPFLGENFGNPSSLYEKGRVAHKAVEKSRLEIAALLGAKPQEIIFTAGGTESINLAIFGVARAVNHPLFKKKGGGVKPHLITSKIEHHAVLRSFEALEAEGYGTSYVDVNSEGFINIKKLKSLVRPETVLISIMYANNEIGTIEPISEIGKWLKTKNQERAASNLPRIIFHTDACQAAGALDLNVQKLGVDLMSVNGSKIYGPKQNGFLFVRAGINIKPLVYGGGQEYNLRSGTENVAGIVGLAEALKLAQKNRLKENSRLSRLRDYFICQLFKKIPKIILNGPDPGILLNSSNIIRLPNNINVSVLGVEGESLLLYLDSYGAAVSTGSACSSTSQDPSHVIMALGRSKSDADSAIRFTLGKFTTKKEINYVMKILPGVVKELRKVRSAQKA